MKIDFDAIGLVHTREPVEVVRSFIRRCWYFSARDQAKAPHSVFEEFAPPIIGHLIKTQPVVALVSKSDEKICHAWACGSPSLDGRPPVLHWAYTPKDLRRKGLAAVCIAAALGEYPSVIYTTFRFAPFDGNVRYRYNRFVLGRYADEGC